MEAYVRQKRAAPGMIQASDVSIIRPKTGDLSGGGGGNSTLINNINNMHPIDHLQQQPYQAHAYDGPMQFTMSPNNPDQLLTSSSTREGYTF